MFGRISSFVLQCDGHDNFFVIWNGNLRCMGCACFGAGVLIIASGQYFKGVVK